MHDMNGKLLAVGDAVVIPGTIKECNGDPNGAFCNVVVAAEIPMGKGTAQEYTYPISLNAGMVAKVEPSCPLEEALDLLKAFQEKYGRSEAGRANAIAITHLQTCILWARQADQIAQEEALSAACAESPCECTKTDCSA